MTLLKRFPTGVQADGAIIGDVSKERSCCSSRPGGKRWRFKLTYTMSYMAQEFLTMPYLFYDDHIEVLVANPDEFVVGAQVGQPPSGHSFMRLDTTPRGVRALSRFSDGLVSWPSGSRRRGCS